MKKRRGNPGLQGRLLEKSIEAYILSLETINKLSIKYRVETFAYLICNAWELLLKAKIISDAKDPKSIFYDRKKTDNSLALKDCIKKIFTSETDPTRCNLEQVVKLRDTSVHLVLSKIPREVLSLFQSCVLNYHKRLGEWFEISLSDRISVGMMTIVYDFSPDQFDLENPILRRQLGREVVVYLTKFQAAIRQEYELLNKPPEFSIDINYTLALVKKIGDGDITLTKGDTGLVTNIVEVAKDPGKTHPYRQGEIVENVNKSSGGLLHINFYDIRCVDEIYGIRKRAEFYFKSAFKNSPSQYSQAFLSWLLKEHQNDPNFFVKARQAVYRNKLIAKGITI